MITTDPHPLLELEAFESRFPQSLGDLVTPPTWLALFQSADTAPMSSDDTIREQVRHLLRHGGFKPTGRSKPASEYLLRAFGEQTLSSINPAVDACNVVSLHSGLPISVVDCDLAQPPFRIGLAEPGMSYVFNASGQSIDLSGLVCLFDKDGPCANAVKDAQRTKTTPETRRTLTIIWGTRSLPGRAKIAREWYVELLESLGVEVNLVPQ